MKKKLAGLALTVLSITNIMAAPDEYEKRSDDSYGDGTIVSVFKEFPDVFEFLEAKHKVEVTVKDPETGEYIKTLRYTIEGFVGESNGWRYDEGDGWLPIKISVTAEDGSDVSVEEAKVALAQIKGEYNGIKAKFINIGRDGNAEYTTDSLQQYNSLNVIELSIDDRLHEFQNGNMIVMSAFVNAGYAGNIKAYGEKVENSGNFFEATNIEYGSSLGVKFKNFIGGSSITPEVYIRGKHLNSDSSNLIYKHEAQKTGFQISLEKAFSDDLACKAAVGISNETVEGTFVEDSSEVYLNGKCEF